MSYGLKYQTQFTSVSDANNPSRDYTLQFLFKDWEGGATTVLGAEVTVIQKCTIDDPVAPIKGQSLDISLLNKNGALPITEFQSEDDDGVQVKLLDNNNNILFTGFLVQDDFYEGMIDYTHPITLSATDSLGLLKGVVLSEAEVRRSFYVDFRTNGVNTTIYVYSSDSAFYPQPGNIIELDSVSYIIATATQENTTIGLVIYNWTITLTTATPGFGQHLDTIYLTGEVNLQNRNSILSLLAVCLAQTNLTLITNIFFNLYEYRQDNTKSTFEQTLLDSQVFISGETYDDCYTALTKILQAFNCTLFQANGQWNIVHWFEMRQYTNNAIPGFVYDETWATLGGALFSNNFLIGPDPQLTRPIFQLTQGALRGYKFTQRTFNYHQPKYLLRNYDFKDLGPLLREYMSGIFRISEYVANGWLGTYGSPAVERFIRVTYDTSLRTEASRYIVLRGSTFDSIRAIPSYPIDCQVGDEIKFSCGFRTNISGIPGSLAFAIMLTDGTTTRYLKNTGATSGNNGVLSWETTFGFSFVYPAGENSNEWHDMDTGFMPKIPFNGQLTIFLPQFTDPPQGSGKESQFKDLRFEYVPYVNDSTKVIGQIHKQEQDVNKKLNEAIEIVIDDSIRNSIAGTLFLTTKTGLLQDRTIYWRYPPDANGWRLGERTTLDELMWRQKTRSKFEGGFIGNWQQSVISLLTMAITDFYPNKNYNFGLLSIDYKNNRFNGTLWELYDNTDAVLVNTYSLTYIYETT